MRSFIISIIGVFACSLMLQAKNYVICVGVADYPGTDQDLLLCANDARTIRDLYVKNGHAETILLTNDSAKTDSIVRALRVFCKKATQNDAIVFFFSGHGSRGAFACYDWPLHYEEITSEMEKSKAKCKIVFADACYSGNARKEKKNNGKKNNNDSSVMFFLSSRSEETSGEFTARWQNGVFTAFLERGLRGAADADKDKIITARELFLYVNRSVSKVRGGQQHPVMWGRFNHTMPVMVWK